jgi:hypothetical protein
MNFDELCRYVDALNTPKDGVIDFMVTSEGLKEQLRIAFEGTKRKEDLIFYFDKGVEAFAVTREDYENRSNDV